MNLNSDLKQNFGKFLLESALIVFSVLLALFLNEYRSQLKDQELKQVALERIEVELNQNREVLAEWLPHHQKILANLTEAINNPQISENLVTQNGEVRLQSLFERSIVQRLITRTAWTAVQSSNAFANVDFDQALQLAELYNLQEIGVESTLKRTLNILGSRESLQAAELRNTLMLLRNGFRELVSQEEFLIHKYDETLASFSP